MLRKLFNIKFALFLIICLGTINAQKINDDIELIHLKDSIYIHKTWFDFPGVGRYPSNGLVYIKNGKALLIDTPASNELTKILCEFLENSLKVEIYEVIVCHSHDDCIGGLKYLHSKGISSMSCSLTKQKCEQSKGVVPLTSFTETMVSSFEGEGIILDHPGGGHTDDNIVVYFANAKILFGGCLLKARNSENLGYVKEAVLEEWGSTVKKVLDRYSDIEIVVPGHGEHGGKEILTHTINLVKNFKEKNKNVSN